MHKVALRETPHRGRAGGRTKGASLTIHASRIDATSHRHAAAGREEDNSQRIKESPKTLAPRAVIQARVSLYKKSSYTEEPTDKASRTIKDRPMCCAPWPGWQATHACGIQTSDRCGRQWGLRGTPNQRGVRSSKRK